MFIRSVVGMTGTLLFFKSITHLMPIVSLMALHTGLIILTVVFRVLALQDLFISITLGKVKGIILLMEFGAVPGLAVVDMDQFGATYPLTMYWAYLVVALISGFFLAIATKMTHNMCRGGLLKHEAQIDFYQHLVSCVVLPVIIAVEYLGRDRHEMDSTEATTFALIWVLIAMCLALRTLITDRRLNERFKVDFDAELPTVPEIVEPRPESPSNMQGEETSIQASSKHYENQILQ
jgi:hypothetical protein